MTKAILFANEKSSTELDPIFTKVYGMTVLERTLHALKRAEVGKVTVVAGENLEAIQKLVDKKKPKKIEVEVVEKDFKSENNTLYIKQPLVVSPNVFKKVIEEKSWTADQNVAFYSNRLIDNSLENIFVKNNSIKFVNTEKEIYTTVQSHDQLLTTKKALRKSLIKPTDGWVSRNLNRPISISVSRILAHTSVTPNQFTVFTGLIGVATGYFMALGGYWYWLLGAFLFHMTSVMDGVDGELARLKFKSSPFGQWLDTVVDNSSYVIGLGGLVVGVMNHGWPANTKIAGILAIGFVVAALGSLYLYLVRFGKGGTLLNVEYSFQEGNSTFDKIMRIMAAFGKRDLFALLFLIMAMFGKLPWALWYVAIMAAAVFGFSLQAHFSAVKKQNT